jgi:pimeloyl-ACP methyl ester carboxylesterase
MDALGIRRAAIVGVSAGGPSAMQFAIRHPDRTAALFLLVPLAYRPAAGTGDSPAPSRSRLFRLYETLLKSDFLFWLAIHISSQTTIGTILATPPELVKSAERSEQERVARVMTHILPVSQRRLGLLNDAQVATTLTRYDLERITAPTLIVSVKDDRYQTFDGSRYTADHIAGARFIGFEKGGHMCVGHNTEIAEQAAQFLNDNR